MSRIRGTGRTREDTEGHEGGRVWVQEDTAGTLGTLEDTRHAGFGTVRQFAAHVAPGARAKVRRWFRHRTGRNWSNVINGCAPVGRGYRGSPSSFWGLLVYSQEVKPTAPTWADFSRLRKYDTHPCRLQSTAGKKLQNRGPRVRILPPLPSASNDFWRPMLRCMGRLGRGSRGNGSLWLAVTSPFLSWSLVAGRDGLAARLSRTDQISQVAPTTFTFTS
jgi:hypothetical protein